MAATRKENQHVALWKGLSIVSFVLFITTLLIVFLYKGRDIPVATVDGVKISQDQLYKALVDYEGPKILEKLILEDLIMKESKAAGVVVTESEFQASFDKVRTSYATQEEFLENLKKDGYTEQSLRTELRTQLYIRKILEPRVTVDDNEVKAHYAEHMSHDPASNTKSEAQVIAEIRDELVNKEILDLMEPWFEELRSKANIAISLPGIQMISPKGGS
ncbi:MULTISPECIES: hypothetical protein [Paenibacillus]|uniref:Peptidylprolyl isomerase n=1 Tax=Paenibacillus anseongense TaxID=2682845 RepID=A0ABW9UB20_9BACL|nr:MULTISPECIES: hypothetical protein [Paenibacillus]MBA2937543.1 hypothetical protein [Paenibacillus sp. CGMCC 1.16610]MVQ36601.1 hypothetical protein [Paenibacillus anseongense]